MYLVTKNPSPNFGTALVQRTMMKPRRGMSCACGNGGLGCACLSGVNGLGLFDTGLDLSGWGPMEWAVIGLGAFALYSMVSTTGRGVRGARKAVRSRSTRRRRREQLRRQLEEV